MVDPRMETYNYYHDSRVQAAMFSSCWNVIHQESDSAVISFDEDWVLETLVTDRIDDIARKWVADKEDFTQAYRDLHLKAQKLKADQEAERRLVLEEHGSFWKVPKAEQERLNALFQNVQDASRIAGEEFGKLYDRAESENSSDDILKQMGFETFRKHDEDYPLSMRVQTKFEVCSQCEGSGKVTNPSIDCCGLTQEDFHEDPDFEEDYFSGRYDVTCPRCRGKRVEAIPQLPAWLNEAIQSRDESEWEGIRESCAERAMGA